MDLEAVKKFLQENASNADVAAYLQGLRAPNLDAVKNYLETAAEGKAFLQQEKDKHFGKSLETWKQNNLNALVDAEVAKRNPEKTPEMLKIEQLEKALADKDAAEKRQTLLNKALQVAGEKGLPTKLVERFLGEDEEKTLALLGEFETELNGAVQAKVDATFKTNGYKPPGAGGGTGGAGATDIKSIVQSAQIRQ